MTDHAEFELIGSDGDVHASASGPRDLALSEILHYSFRYERDGEPHKIIEITRTECDRNKLIEELS